MKHLKLTGLLCAAVVGLSTIVSAEPRHGLSAFGDLKYPAEFKHFYYVNPDAPKGGRIVTLSHSPPNTFDTMNGYILKGDRPFWIDYLFDTLMVRAFDEPDAVYGLAAKSAEVSDDRMSVTFTMRPEARFSDGSPLTAADVVESFRLIKEHGHPRFSVSLRDVERCELVGEDKVRYVFSGKNVRDLPLTVAVLPIFSKAYYDNPDNDFTKTTLVAPVGSGPYKVKKFQQGDFITYERRDEYWAKDLPVNVGKFNFGEIKIVYFRDRTAELEALKAGLLDLREEFTSKHWATEYELNSVKEGRLIKLQLPDERTSGTQGFFLNMRRAKFSDPRTRQALGMVFDFEWTNSNLFYDLYKRTGSYFENSERKATGVPSADELVLLEPLREELPPAVFQEAIDPPKSDGSGQDRKLLRQANNLLQAAGWRRKGTQLVDAAGDVMKIEFLTVSPGFERIIAPFIRNLKLLGIDASMRLVEPAQYQRQLKEFEFDIVSSRFSMLETPGVELMNFFSSETANVSGSYNLSGINSKAVDKLIDHLSQARSRSDLTTAARALDRTLRAHRMWVPHWYKGSHGVVHWDMFGRPKIKPRFDRGILETWWIDAEKAASIKRGP